MKWLRMRPLDITELDESAKWHDLYGGDPEETVNGNSAGGLDQNPIARRKKAPVRSRRRIESATSGAGCGGSADGNANGMGDVG